jgi:hypothetical protein
MPESGTYGSVRGALSNGRPYRDSNSYSSASLPKVMRSPGEFVGSYPAWGRASCRDQEAGSEGLEGAAGKAQRGPWAEAEPAKGPPAHEG